MGMGVDSKARGKFQMRYAQEVIVSERTWRLWPIPILMQTSVSSEERPLIKRSSSHSTTPIQKSKMIVDLPEHKVSELEIRLSIWEYIPNAKYPNSWPHLTCSASLTVVWMLPTIIAPTHTVMTRPKAEQSMGTILHTFSPQMSRAVWMAWEGGYIEG